MDERSGSSNLLEDSSIQEQFSFESIMLFEERFANEHNIYKIYKDHDLCSSSAIFNAYPL